jgi:hypothetical protein
LATDQPVDANVLHDLLVAELTKEGMTNLLREEGGSCTFGVSWAQRFFNRHNLKVKPSTKRARNNVDSEEKIWHFENNLALTIAEYNVPPSLVFSMDEVPVVFSPSTSRIKSIKASSSVSAIQP